MVFVTGDCHGEYGRFSAKVFGIQKEMDRGDLVVVAGDFGYWDRSKEQDDPGLKEKKRELERVGALYRINHLSWWKEEMPDEAQRREGLGCMEEHGWKCDYIISHCAPSSVQAVFSLGDFKPDPLTGYLEEIRRRCRYIHWFFGHYHMDRRIDDRHTVLYRDIMRIL